MWVVYWHSRLVMRDVLPDKVIYVLFLPPQPPTSLHKAGLYSWLMAAGGGGCSAFMSLRAPTIYQTSAGFFDLWQHVTWSYMSWIDFGCIVANMACMNLNVGFCQKSFIFLLLLFFSGQCVSFSFGCSRVQFLRSPFIGPEASGEIWFTAQAPPLHSRQRDHLMV